MPLTIHDYAAAAANAYKVTENHLDGTTYLMSSHTPHRNETINKNAMAMSDFPSMPMAAANEIPSLGYFGKAHYNEIDNSVIIGHCGSNFLAGATGIQHIISDLEIAFGKVPRAHKEAIKFTNTVVDYLKNTLDPQKFKTLQIIHVGHSLGGCHAQLIAAHDPTHRCFAFESPGIKPLLPQSMQGNNFDNITSYQMGPNLVNSLHPHVGIVYRLTPVASDLVYDILYPSNLQTLTNEIGPIYKVRENGICYHGIAIVQNALKNQANPPKLLSQSCVDSTFTAEVLKQLNLSYEQSLLDQISLHGLRVNTKQLEGDNRVIAAGDVELLRYQFSASRLQAWQEQQTHPDESSDLNVDFGLAATARGYRQTFNIEYKFNAAGSVAIGLGVASILYGLYHTVKKYYHEKMHPPTYTREEKRMLSLDNYLNALQTRRRYLDGPKKPAQRTLAEIERSNLLTDSEKVAFHFLRKSDPTKLTTLLKNNIAKNALEMIDQIYQSHVIEMESQGLNAIRNNDMEKLDAIIHNMTDTTKINPILEFFRYTQAKNVYINYCSDNPSDAATHQVHLKKMQSALQNAIATARSENERHQLNFQYALYVGTYKQNLEEEDRLHLAQMTKTASSTELICLAQVLRDNEHYDTAKTIATAVVTCKQTPAGEKCQAGILLGDIAFLSKEYNEAKKHYESARKLHPKDKALLYSTALTLAKLDENAQCQMLLVEYAAMKNNTDGDKLNIASLALAIGEENFARQFLREITKSAAADREQKSKAYYLLGNIQSRTHYHLARYSYNKALSLWPNNFSAYNSLAELHISQEHYQAALDCYEHCVADKTDTRIGIKIALLQQRMGHKKEALAQLEKSYSHHPDKQAAVNLIEKIDKLTHRGLRLQALFSIFRLARTDRDIGTAHGFFLDSPMPELVSRYFVNNPMEDCSAEEYRLKTGHNAPANEATWLNKATKLAFATQCFFTTTRAIEQHKFFQSHKQVATGLKRINQAGGIFLTGYALYQGAYYGLQGTQRFYRTMPNLRQDFSKYQGDAARGLNQAIAGATQFSATIFGLYETYWERVCFEGGLPVLDNELFHLARGATSASSTAGIGTTLFSGLCSLAGFVIPPPVFLVLHGISFTILLPNECEKYSTNAKIHNLSCALTQGSIAIIYSEFEKYRSEMNFFSKEETASDSKNDKALKIMQLKMRFLSLQKNVDQALSELSHWQVKLRDTKNVNNRIKYTLCLLTLKLRAFCQKEDFDNAKIILNEIKSIATGSENYKYVSAAIDYFYQLQEIKSLLENKQDETAEKKLSTLQSTMAYLEGHIQTAELNQFADESWNAYLQYFYVYLTLINVQFRLERLDKAKLGYEKLKEYIGKNPALKPLEYQLILHASSQYLHAGQLSLVIGWSKDIELDKNNVELMCLRIDALRQKYMQTATPSFLTEANKVTTSIEKMAPDNLHFLSLQVSRYASHCPHRTYQYLEKTLESAKNVPELYRPHEFIAKIEENLKKSQNTLSASINTIILDSSIVLKRLKMLILEVFSDLHTEMNQIQISIRQFPRNTEQRQKGSILDALGNLKTKQANQSSLMTQKITLLRESFEDVKAAVTSSKQQEKLKLALDNLVKIEKILHKKTQLLLIDIQDCHSDLEDQASTRIRPHAVIY